MFRIEVADGDEVLLVVDPAMRRHIIGVLTDWLAVYAGVEPLGLSPENFDLVVELRRLLLSPDERARHAPTTRKVA